MNRAAAKFLLSVGLLFAAFSVRGDEPEAILNALKPVTPEAVTVIELPTVLPYQRMNRYDVWQYYGVDRQGYWRARVAFTPHGAFYLYNGEPYPFWPNRPQAFMSYVFD